MPRRLRSEVVACWLVALLWPLMAAAQPTAALAGLMGDLRWSMPLKAAQRTLQGGLSAVAHPPGFLRDELEPARDSVWLARDAVSQTFHVYREGRLRMLYTVFEPLAFPEGNFEAFTASLQRRLGPGRWRNMAGRRRWVEWHDRSTRARAIDQTNAYGFYCLVLTPNAPQR